MTTKMPKKIIGGMTLLYASSYMADDIRKSQRPIFYIAQNERHIEQIKSGFQFFFTLN